uniref:Putative norcoclaurine synthase n=1 Tax=Papaver bracteatum TaxID=215227 RepID=C3SBT7_PAPBR|nr:putative norcoclaurine synthase [Papaver bracteatum]
MMRKVIKYDMEVATSADSVWAVYSSPDIPRLLRDVLLPGVFEKLDVIEGNGGVGTVLDIAFPPGAVPRSYKEKFVNIDRVKRLKEVIMIEGGYLDMGCTFYLDRIHVVEKAPSSCVIESSIVYEVEEEYADVMSKLITTEPLKSMAEVISNYVIQKESVSARNIFNRQSVVKKEIHYDLEVPTSADSIWAVYSNPDIPRLLRDVLLPGVFEKLDVIAGNGGVGTILDIAFPLGAVPRRYKEKFVKINHEKRLKEVIMIEGGYLDMGCTFYMDRIHVFEKTPNSCVIESSIIYEVKEEYADKMAKLITTEPLQSMAEVISGYVLKKRLQVFGFEIKPTLRFNLLLCLIICLVIAGGMLIGRVPL